MSDAPPEAATDDFSCRLARTPHEHDAYFALRREIFCEEQRVFAGDDRDEHDDGAHPIVCLLGTGEDAPVVGVVRIWETAAGDWWGGRLGVHRDFRAAATIGRRLVQTAVGTARAWGAWRFRATVQRPNVAFFRRLRWRTLEELELFAQPHHLMEADLMSYTPVPAPLPSSSIVLVRDRDAA